MDMTPALPALSPSRLASTRSDVVEQKKASRGQAKIFFLSEFVRLRRVQQTTSWHPGGTNAQHGHCGDAMETERLVSCPKAALTT
jgi:hypothetical protein